MPVEVSHASPPRVPGRRWPVAWVLILILVLALALAFGAVVVRAVVVRDRSPLASRPLLIRTLDHPLILLGGSPQNRFDPPPAGQRAGIPAVVCGLLMAMFRPVRMAIDPLIAALFPIPKIALMPLLLLALGFGEASKIALVAIAVFFPVCVNTYVGASNIEKIYWDVAKNYGASQTVMFTRIVFFGALPTIFAGIRIALAVSFIVLVAAEFVATKSGIGYLIWNSWELLQVDIMFVGIVTIGILGLITSALLQELERIVIPWKAE